MPLAKRTRVFSTAPYQRYPSSALSIVSIASAQSPTLSHAVILTEALAESLVPRVTQHKVCLSLSPHALCAGCAFF
jgi:hypothetical protein